MKKPTRRQLEGLTTVSVHSEHYVKIDDVLAFFDEQEAQAEDERKADVAGKASTGSDSKPAR